MATVKSFEIEGFINSKLALRTRLKINSYKLAEKRFRKRYGNVLLGAWRIDVKLDNKKVHSFMLNQLELDLDKGNKSVPLREQKSSHVGINPCIKAGKLAMQALEKSYTDGTLPMSEGAHGKMHKIIYMNKSDHWTGRGRRPQWLIDYEASGGKLADIKLDYSNCKE